MSRLGDFVLGAMAGAALTAGTMNFHVVRAESGFHFVRKLSAGLKEPYVDVREFTPTDWNEHRELAAALIRSGKGDVLQDSSLAGLKSSIENWLGGLERGK